VSLQVTRLIDNEIYARKAIAEAQNAFRSFCKVKASPAATGKIELSFLIAPSHQGNAREVVLEFLNYALDRSVQLNQEESA